MRNGKISKWFKNVLWHKFSYLRILRRLVEYLDYAKDLLTESDNDLLKRLVHYPFWVMQDGAREL